MTSNRLKLILFLLIAFEGCTGFGQIIDKSTLSSDEIEKVQAVKTYKENELNDGAYKIIKKIKGLSCLKLTPQFFSSSIYKVREVPETAKAIEQAKIYAVRAGGNAITNVSCQKTKNDWVNNCWNSIVCTADAIQVD
jgi:hypothetical protein